MAQGLIFKDGSFHKTDVKMSAFLRLFLKNWRTRSVLIPVFKRQPEAAAGNRKKEDMHYEIQETSSL